jgi:ribosomal protein L11 methyltransferase
MTIKVKPFSDDILDILSAELAEIGFEGFYETNKSLMAYIPVPYFKNKIFFELIQKPSLRNLSIEASHKILKEKNWNEAWEKSFEPVVIDHICQIRAPFHKDMSSKGFDILIEPKMSFGTGHHATTHMMVSEILKLEIKGKSVLDIGTGTGILAILAAKKGANKITALDHDKWSFSNCMENLLLNHIDHVEVILGETEQLNEETFNLIFANINKPVILKEIHSWNKLLEPDGNILLCGILTDDEPEIKMNLPEDLKIVNKRNLNQWLFLNIQKS